MDYKVYIHRRLDNDEIFYVGHGQPSRPYATLRGRSQAWQDIYKKYGRRVEVIGCYTDKTMAAIHEIMYISGCRELGIPIVNVKSGGFDRNEGVPMSAATREKISAARLKTNGNRKKIKTPLGIFNSMAAAARAHNLSIDQIYYRKNTDPDFQLI
jgi:hypothetical protein